MTNNDFLPVDYEPPAGGGNYMKFQDGENKFRILSKPIVGWLDWKDKKPYRFKMKNKPDKPMEQNPIKHFWAFVVWNYSSESIQILEVTQQTIQSAITNLYKDEEWGAPFHYDIKVNKKGKALDTEYSVTPSPKRELNDIIIKASLDKPCYLEALFEGKDPWVVTDKHTEIETLPF